MTSVELMYDRPTFSPFYLKYNTRIYARSQNLPAAAASSIETATNDFMGFPLFSCRNKVGI